MKAQTTFFEEIIVDGFAGGGGWSWGIEQATGAPVDVAINHDPDAILMHKTNHPFTDHYCESIFDVDPVEAVRGRPVGWAHFSPDCKHFSKAKGGKPVEKRIRGLAWVVLRWAGTVRPRIISLENVEEFKTWGPVRRGQPVKARRGETFEKFVAQLRALGYAVEWRELRACDYGAPTIRKRFFLLARCDGKPIVWPQPTHGDPKSPEVQSGQLAPWRTAGEIIDWSLPCPSIFERKKPLAENTQRRIARGIQKFVIENPEPFIVQVNHGGEGFRGQRMDEPLPTVTVKHGYGLVNPIIAPFITVNNANNVPSGPNDPVRTITTGNRNLLTTPLLIQYHSEKSPGEVRGQTLDDPIQTVDASNRYGFVAPTLTEVGYGEAPGQLPRAPGLQKPLGTIVAKEKHAVVSAFLAKHYGGNYSGPGSTPAEPLHTVTAQDHNSLVTAHVMKMKGDNIGQPAGAPLQTITSGGLHFAEVRAFLIKYYGQGVGQPLTEPLHTVTSDDRFGLVTIHGTEYQIVDIGMRMLSPRELYNAQGFPSDYVIDRDYTGKAYPKSKQVARCGNAVPPPFACALVRANWPERCRGVDISTVAQLYKLA